MKVSQIMHKNPVCVTIDESLTNIARQMQQGDFGAVIVKSDHKPLGVITDRDIVVRALAKQGNTGTLKAKDVMTDKIITCNLNDTIETATAKMKKDQIRRILVTDDNNHLVGILSLGDIAVSEKGNEKGTVFETFEKISERH